MTKREISRNDWINRILQNADLLCALDREIAAKAIKNNAAILGPIYLQNWTVWRIWRAGGLKKKWQISTSQRMQQQQPCVSICNQMSLHFIALLILLLCSTFHVNQVGAVDIYSTASAFVLSGLPDLHIADSYLYTGSSSIAENWVFIKFVHGIPSTASISSASLQLQNCDASCGSYTSDNRPLELYLCFGAVDFNGTWLFWHKKHKKNIKKTHKKKKRTKKNFP